MMRCTRCFAGLLLLVLAACAGERTPPIGDIIQARALSEEGLARLNAGDNHGAIRALTQVIAYNGGEYRDYTRRATAYASLNQYGAALRDLDQALRLAPDRWRTHLLRAITHQKAGAYREAIADLDRAIALQPKDGELLRRRAYLQLLTGGFDAAVRDYEALARVMPGSEVAAFGRGVALYLSGAWPDAAAEFDRQLRSRPEDGIAALWLVKASLRNNAEITWDQFVAKAGPDPEWAMVRTLLSAQSHDDAAREMQPYRDPAEGRRTMGACEEALFLGTWSQIRGDAQKARASLDSAERTCPADSIEGAEARTELARVQRTHK
jgi:tetratricopeptide (TPR) repeat protein